MRRFVPVVLATAALCLMSNMRADEKSSGEKSSGSPPSVAGPLNLRFTDDSLLKATVRDEKITFVTEYGKLEIPVAHIQKLELGRRVPADVAKTIADAIAKLGSDDFQERERATAKLLELGTKAYPEILAASNSDDAEVKRRAADILDKIKSRITPDAPELRPYDIIWTKNSKITGKVDGDTLQVRAIFGDTKVKLVDLRSVRGDNVEDREGKRPDALPDPGSLVAYTGQFGTKVTFTVTGQPSGAIYGTDVYTVDSTLATAAVHAGVIKAGETGTVYVEIVQSPPNFQATTRNGVTSYAWDAYPPGSYKFINKPSPILAPRAGNLAARCVDGSVLDLTLRDEKLTIVTDKGKVTVAVADIRKLELASRTPEDIADKVAAAIKKLGSDDVKERERASADLLILGPRAYSALVAAAAKGDAEVKVRIKNIIARLKESVPADLLEIRDSDVISTKDGKITGKLDVSSLKVKSPHLGDLELRLADIESLRSALADEETKKPK